MTWQICTPLVQLMLTVNEGCYPGFMTVVDVFTWQLARAS